MTLVSFKHQRVLGQRIQACACSQPAAQIQACEAGLPGSRTIDCARKGARLHFAQACVVFFGMMLFGYVAPDEREF